MLDLYKNIKKYRIENNLSQSELAAKVGYADKTMISRIENGNVDLPQSKIVEFANALGVTPGTLMGWTSADNEENGYILVKETYPLFDDRPDIKELVDVAKESTPDNVKVATTMLKGLKNNVIEKVSHKTKVLKTKKSDNVYTKDLEFITVDGKKVLVDKNAVPGQKSYVVAVKKPNNNVG